MVAWALAAPRVALPHAAEVATRLGHPVDGLIVLGGTRARAACAALRARAFAVDNIVAFADEAPPLATVVHEVAHVAQRRAFFAPRAHFAPGSLAIASHGDRAEAEARALVRAPRGAVSAAPRQLYREDDPDAEPKTPPPWQSEILPTDTTIDIGYDGFKPFTKQLIRLLLASKFTPKQITTEAKTKKGGTSYKAVFGVRGTDGTFSTTYPYSSSEPFTLNDAFNELSLPTVAPAPDGLKNKRSLSTYLFNARQTALFASVGARVGGQHYVVRGVGSPTLQQAVYYAFIGIGAGPSASNPPPIVQEIAAASYDKSSPDEILDDYQRVIVDARAKNAAGAGVFEPAKKLDFPPAMAQVETDIATAKTGLVGKARGEQWTSVEGVRKTLVEAIITGWPDIDQLHFQVIDTKALNDQSGLKGNIFEAWVGKYVNKAGYTPDTKVEPVFGRLIDGKLFKSAKLLKVRHGDGFLKVSDHQYIIAEAKAYTSGPSSDKDEVVLQIQDYNVVLRSTPPVQGYLKVNDELKPFPFTEVHYNFSNADVAKKWVPYLDRYLPGKYKILAPANFTDAPTPTTALKAYKDAVGKFKKLNGTSLKVDELTSLETDITAALGKPTESDEGKKQLDTDAASITTRLAKTIATGFPKKIDALYKTVLSPTPAATQFFEAPHLAMLGRIFEAWVTAEGLGLNLDNDAQNPLRGEVSSRKPVFSEEARALTFQSTTFRQVVDSKQAFSLVYNAEAVQGKEGVIIPAAIVVAHPELTGAPSPARPNDAETKELADIALLITKGARAYYQSKAGSSNTVVAHKLSALKLTFGDIAAAEPWAKAVQANLKDKQTYDVTPNPDGEKSFSLFITANPTIELKVTDADKLEHTFTAADIKVAAKNAAPKAGDKVTGATVSEAKIKLKTQRSKEIDSGSITMSIAAGEVVKSPAPTAKPITPAIDPAKPKAPVHGSIENKVGGLTSPLDKLLKRVTTSASLTDTGIKGTIGISPGPSGLANIDLEAATVSVTYSGGTNFVVDGTIGLRHSSGKMSGALIVKWAKGALSITGKVDAQAGLLPGLEEFKGEIEYTKTTAEAAEGVEPTTTESLKIRVKSAKLRKAMKGVTFVGAIENLEYDGMTGLFSGTVKDLGVEMGPFGKATGTAVFKDSELTSVVITYASPELKFPKDKPLVSGTLTTTIGYQDGKWSGGITGTALLAIPALQKLAPKTADNKPAPPLGLDVKVALSPEGGWSGTIGTTTAIALGKYFSIDKIELKLAETGDVSGTFGLTVKGIRYLKEATAVCTFDKTGFKVASFSITGEIAKTDTSRFWGTITATWDGKNFVVTLEASVKIRDNIVGHGKLIYDSATNELSGDLSVAKIQILGPSNKPYKLFEFKKQIPLFAFPAPPVVGLYLEVGIEVGFNIAYDISVTPKLTLKGFSLDTFKFASVSASMALDASLAASLDLVPSVGLGLFVLSPMVVRAGGGLKLPVSAKATVEAKSTPTVRYEPEKPGDPDSEYKLKTWLPISLAVKFGINAKLQAYADFVLLDGMFTYPWVETLTEFEIMPERELMRYTFSLGDPPQGADPATGPGKAPPQGADQPETKASGREEKTVDKTVKDTPDTAPKKEPKEPTGSADEGFDLKSLLGMVKKLEAYKKLASLIESAADVLGAIGAFFKKIYEHVRKWLGAALEAIEDAIRKIRDPNIGLFGWIKGFLGDRIRAVSPTLADLILPVLDALMNSEAELRDLLFGANRVTTVGGFLDMAFKLIPILMGAAWDSATAFGKGLLALWDKLKASAASKIRGLIDELIAAKKLGVMRGTGTTAYGYRINIGPISSEGFDDAGSRVIATALLVALEAIGATPVGDGYWA